LVAESTLATSAEKSVACCEIDSRWTVTPAPCSVLPTMSARPVEYASWSSTIMTLDPLLAPSFSCMYLASVGPCTPSFGTTRKK
jgi:hypothetical protein